MNYKNNMTLKFPSLSQNESFARSAVSFFALQLNPSVAQISDIKTAVSEAVTNAIVHGYKEKTGRIYITASIYEDNVLKIKIRDKGVGIEDINKAMEPLFTTAGDDRSGLGFSVMESFMDSVRVRSALGKGTTVILTKKLSGKSE
jgi:stage II sporulation protein AB (anti-sigma F factor)